MYLGQLNVVLIGAIVETIMPIVVVDIAGMREPIEEGKHVLEPVSMQMVLSDGHEELVGRGERQFGDDRERRGHVDEHDELDALALGYLADEVLEGARDVFPRLCAVMRQRRVLVALLFE